MNVEEFIHQYMREHGTPEEIIMKNEITPRDPENWVQVDGGWMRVKRGKGNTIFFASPIPPMRDTMNRPLVWNGAEWVIDNVRLIQEVNEGKWKPPQR